MGPITPRRFATAPEGATGGRPPDPLPSPFSRCADDFPFIDRCACVLAPEGGSTPALYLFELDHDFKQEDRKAAYTPTVGYWVKECSKDKLVLERFEVNTDGPNLLEGDVTFRRMGKYTK